MTDKKLIEPLIQTFNNDNNKYILPYIKDIKSLKILADFINSILYVPKDSKDFFEKIDNIHTKRKHKYYYKYYRKATTNSI